MSETQAYEPLQIDADGTVAAKGTSLPPTAQGKRCRCRTLLLVLVALTLVAGLVGGFVFYQGGGHNLRKGKNQDASGGGGGGTNNYKAVPSPQRNPKHHTGHEHKHLDDTAGGGRAGGASKPRADTHDPLDSLETLPHHHDGPAERDPKGKYDPSKGKDSNP